MPERFGFEMLQLLGDRDDLHRRLVEITVGTLPWRDPSKISGTTGRILEESLGLPGFSTPAFDVALAITALPSPVDALWLHDILARPAMSDRDGFWCGYLHQSFEEGRGPAEKLIRIAFRVDPTKIPVEVAERWALVLVWFCAAADRRVRDHATKALVRITEPCPSIWARLLSKLSEIDDEYVVERGLAAGYGVLLRTRDPEAEALVAGAAHRLVFADSSRFQNALIRDHARSILELAAEDGALPPGIVESSYMPPYESGWPLRAPSAEEIDLYKDSHNKLPRLYRSCLHDDFNHYLLSRLLEYHHAMGRPEMGRWIFNEVLEMGYGREMLGDYDGYMIYKYGSGRGRPSWAERIGKKYQWIALARLAALSLRSCEAEA